MSPAVVLSEGQLFAGRYKIEAQIGKGAYGAVYRARDTTLDSRVALKVLSTSRVESETVRQNLMLEARVSGRVESDHIVKILDVASDEATGAPYLVMELLKGVSLQQLIDDNGPLRPELAATYLRQLARGLDKAHGYVTPDGVPAPIVHRDLKPDNLFLTKRDDGTPCLKILDFGIAKLLQSSMTATVAGKGTPVYMAFEQAAGKQITPKTDIWALGLIAFTLLTGRPFWRAANRRHAGIDALYAEILTLDIPRPSDRVSDFSDGVTLPGAFDDWFVQCVNRDPDKRFSSAGRAAEHLERILWSMPARTGATPWVRTPDAFSTESQPSSTGMLAPTSSGVHAASAHLTPSSTRPAVLGSPALTVLANRWRPLAVLGGLVVALAVTVVVLLSRREGNVALTVAGPKGEALDSVALYLDGQRVCERSPCRVTTRAGAHVVSASAQGYAAPPSETVTVQGGKDTALHFTFTEALTGGLRVSGSAPGLVLHVDGREIGPLPQQLDGLSAGRHEVRIAGNRSFADVKKSVLVEAGKTLSLGEIRPPVAQGSLKVRAAKNAKGAKIRLESGDYQRDCPKPPFSLDVDTSRKNVIHATKPGYEDYERELVFADGKAELTIEIALLKKGAGERKGTEPPARAAGSAPTSPTSAEAAGAVVQASSERPGARGQLNIQSTPRSNVVLDGQKLGSTPRFGVSVAPGSHSVVFVHPERGTKQLSVSVGPGESKTVAVQF